MLTGRIIHLTALLSVSGRLYVVSRAMYFAGLFSLLLMLLAVMRDEEG